MESLYFAKKNLRNRTYTNSQINKIINFKIILRIGHMNIKLIKELLKKNLKKKSRQNMVKIPLKVQIIKPIFQSLV